MVDKVISGGQTGADEAGLKAAYDLGIKTGGTAPKGWRICYADGSEGANPKLGTMFGLVEHPCRNFQKRTIQNVRDADATVLFGYTDSPGAKLTLRSCVHYDKPYIINPSVAELRGWLDKYDVKILNVAGNRASDLNPDIYEKTYKTLYEALKLVL